MLKFDRQGLIPAVIQDDVTNEMLMLAFMNEEAYRLTRETGYTHFFSRSRNAIWRKGEQSGHVQEVRAIFVNCEENSLLVRVTQHGDAACHTGYRSCYYRRILPDDSYEITAERIFDPDTVYGAHGKNEDEGVTTQGQDTPEGTGTKVVTGTKGRPQGSPPRIHPTPAPTMNGMNGMDGTMEMRH